MSSIQVDKKKAAHGKNFTSPLPTLLDPVNAIDAIVAKALATSTKKMGLDDTQIFINHLQKGTSMACNYYCYNIVRELGEVLGSWSKNIKAIYVCNYDDAASGEDFFEEFAALSLVHVIIWVDQKSKALNALLDAIDGALVQKHRQLLERKHLGHALDAQVIDDTDVKNRTGYAALIKSVYQPPIQVWQTGPEI